MFDPPCEDTAHTITEAQTLGLKVKILTGDAIAIASLGQPYMPIKSNCQPHHLPQGPSRYINIEFGGCHLEFLKFGVYMKVSANFSSRRGRLEQSSDMLDPADVLQLTSVGFSWVWDSLGVVCYF